MPARTRPPEPGPITQQKGMHLSHRSLTISSARRRLRRRAPHPLARILLACRWPVLAWAAPAVAAGEAGAGPVPWPWLAASATVLAGLAAWQAWRLRRQLHGGQTSAMADQGSGGAADASLSAGVGTPTLDGFGIVGGNIHTAEEYAEVESVVPRVYLLSRMIMELAKR